jgi:hypothetical protein
MLEGDESMTAIITTAAAIIAISTTTMEKHATRFIDIPPLLDR